jgi:hypothetical protein
VIEEDQTMSRDATTVAAAKANGENNEPRRFVLHA